MSERETGRGKLEENKTRFIITQYIELFRSSIAIVDSVPEGF